MPAARCIALLGGSFDPVHNGHLALGDYFTKLLAPDELRLLPAGNPWQKPALYAAAADRVAMLQIAFAHLQIPVSIDQQEIRRHTASYTVDSLRAIRAETGAETSLVFLLGADQLQQLDTWHEWRRLFDYAHVCAASRPGFAMDGMHVPQIVLEEFARRAGTAQQIRTTSHGAALLATNLTVDISATQIRSALGRGEHPDRLLAPGVLDYIEQHHLYKANGY